jgi:hypothetical protein
MSCTEDTDVTTAYGAPPSLCGAPPSWDVGAFSHRTSPS